MSNIENLGIYGEFSRDAEAFIKKIQDVAVDDAAFRKHAEGAIVGAAAVGLAIGGYKVCVYAVDQYKSKAEERKAITAAATEKLKSLFMKAQKNEVEADGDPRDTDGRRDEN